MINRNYAKLIVLPALIVLIWTGMAIAADFSVSPVRLFLEPKKNTMILKIKNNVDDKLAIQISAFVWSQDMEGKDVYTETDDVVLFPKMININGLEERILRVGMKAKAENREKTYRVFLEEMPQPGKQEGVAVKTKMRVGVPIFIEPLAEKKKGDIESAVLENGTLSVLVKNAGNAHFIVRTVKAEGSDASGQSVFKAEQNGWYILEGFSKVYTFGIAADECKKIKTLTIDITTDKLSMNKKLDVNPDMCSK